MISQLPVETIVQKEDAMDSLTFTYFLAAVGALGLFVYLGYALLRPEKF